MIVPSSNFLQKLLLAVSLMSAGLLLSGSAAADRIDDAVNSSARPPADRERDVTSRPAEVLRFFGIPTQGVVVDLFAGGGYYSELVSRTLGDSGTVYLHNNAAYLGFAGDAVNERLGHRREAARPLV